MAHNQDAAIDVSAGWVEVRGGECACGRSDLGLNVDGRCFFCAVAFVRKIRSIAIHAEPWGLKTARKGGFSTY